MDKHRLRELLGEQIELVANQSIQDSSCIIPASKALCDLAQIFLLIGYEEP